MREYLAVMPGGSVHRFALIRETRSVCTAEGGEKRHWTQ